MAETQVVQMLLEYKPKFGVTVIEPLVDKLWLTEIAPRVVAVNVMATSVRAIIYMGILGIVISVAH